MLLKLNTLIIATVTSVIVAACTQTETAEDTATDIISNALIKVQNILTESNSVSDVQYQLSYNEDFPCQVTIQEDSENTGNRWLKRYQFDLTNINKNMNTGNFIQSKPERRAIIYTSTKYEPDTNEKKFKPVKINNFSLQTNATERNQHLIITEINKAIALCEEEYGFNESETP